MWDSMSKLQVLLVTGRTIYQGVGKESGKLSDEYMNNVAICELDSNDFQQLNLTKDEGIQVTTQFGSVVLWAVESLRSPHPGIIFVPYSLYANLLIDTETHGTGMPSFKGIPAEIEPSTEQPTKLRVLLRKYFGK
jgi:formylmethanofuran dehydrogenase subunit D